MICLAPITLSNPDRVVRCGRCQFCKQRRRIDWTIRLNHEMKAASNGLFVTLTYNEENVPRDENDHMVAEKDDIQKFIKRLRHISKSKIRYFITTEYGPANHRPHYHGCLFNFTPEPSGRKGSYLRQIEDLVEKTWQKGFATVDHLNPARIHYTTGYIMDNEDDGRKYVTLMSRNPGLGFSYTAGQTHKSGYIVINGRKMRMPRYYSEKLFSEQERKEISEEAMRSARETEIELKRKFRNRGFDAEEEYHKMIIRTYDILEKKVKERKSKKN